MHVRSRGGSSCREVRSGSRWALLHVMAAFCASAAIGVEAVEKQDAEDDVRAIVVEALERMDTGLQFTISATPWTADRC